MGPVREIKKRRKKKMKVNPNGLFATATSLLQSVDWWDEFSKRLTGTLSSKSKEPANFESLFKISRKTFNYICSLVKDDLMEKSTYFVYIHGNPLSLNDCVAVALLRLSSGDSLSMIGESLSINQSTVAQITWRFVEAIEERGLHHLHWPETESLEAEDIKSNFEKLGLLPNCCGAIDTTRIMMSFSLNESNSIWCDRDKKHSMILQAIVGPDMRFLDVVAGWPGSLCESSVLKNSSFFTLAEESKRLNGKRIELQEYIVGHAGFPLLPWLLTPYKGKKLSDSQISLNKQISATQVIAKRALFQLKDTWKIIGGMMWRPDKNRLPRIIFGCCILHNILIDLEDEVQMKKPLPYNQQDSSRKSHVYKDGSKSDSNLREKVCLQLSRKQLDSPQ